MSRITKPSSAGAAANRSIAASASATSASAPRSSSVSTRTPVAGMPHCSSCPWRSRSSTAARMSGMAPSRSPRRALSRAEYTLTSGKSHRLCLWRRNALLTSVRSCCPRSRSAAVSRCTSARPSVTRAVVNAWSSPDRSAFRRHPRSRAPRDRRASARQRGSPRRRRGRPPWRSTWRRRCGPGRGRGACLPAIRDDPGRTGVHRVLVSLWAV